jgi:hypothetical protein
MAIYKITVWLSAICPWSCVSRRTYPPPQCVDGHEDDLVKDPLWSIIAFEQAESQLFIFNFLEGGQARQEGLVREEACCEDEYRDGYDYVGKGKSDALRRRDCHFSGCTMDWSYTRSSIVGQSHLETRRNWSCRLVSPFQLSCPICDAFLGPRVWGKLHLHSLSP